MSDLNTASSTTPVLGDAFTERTAAESANVGDWDGNTEVEGDVAVKKRILGLGKKGEEKTRAPVPLGVTSHPSPTVRSGSPTMGPPPPRSASPAYIPASPGRMAQASPRITSPTSSLIFERNVQEEVAPAAASPAIPSHIATENHIPPVLEVASMAITNDHLDPDSVEIVTHAAHQPAATTINSELPLTPIPSATSVISTDRDAAPQIPPPELATSPIMVPLQASMSGAGAGSPPTIGGESAIPASEDGTSTFGANAPNYGSLDSTDVRRLSFISFADVVHAEQVAGGDNASMRDSVVISPVPPAGSPPPPGIARSPSPLRSPASPSLSAASGTGSGHGPHTDLEASPSSHLRTGSPSAGIPFGSGQASVLQTAQGSSPPVGNTGGELTIETLGQTLRNTGGNDLSGAKSSATLNEDA